MNTAAAARALLVSRSSISRISCRLASEKLTPRLMGLGGERHQTFLDDIAGMLEIGRVELRDGNFPFRDSDGNTINAKRRLFVQLMARSEPKQP